MLFRSLDPQRATLPDFDARDGLAAPTLVELWGWTEPQFLQRTEGSPIRRIGHARWLRNLALAAGNALASDALTAPERESLQQALQALTVHTDPVVQEQVAWSLARG